MNLQSAPEKRIFYVSVLVFTLLSLWPVWHHRFLPMQDYPQHLFISYAASTFGNPAFDWPANYTVNLKFDPYSLFYNALKFFHTFTGIESAGKLFFSVYIILTGFLAFRASRLFKTHTPWGLLLLFPFSFNQIYYLGFTNYIISVPILLLALLDLEDFTHRPLFAWSMIKHLIYQMLLFFSHPYSVLVYLVLAYAAIIFYFKRRHELKKAFIAPVVLTVIFFSWYIVAYISNVAAQGEVGSIRWWPLEGAATYFMLMFTGMRWNGGVDIASLLIWIAVAGLFIVNGLLNRRALAAPRKTILFLILTLLGVIAMPFWYTFYSYFSLRMLAISYFLIALALASIRFTKGTQYAYIGLVAALLLISSDMQGKVSKETEEVVPLLSGMERNSKVLPMMFDSSSLAMDPFYFYQIHSHEVNYYHVLTGGGANPTLFYNALIPVQQRQDVFLPVPGDIDSFNAGLHGPYYRYILARSAPAGFIGYMSENGYTGKQSGSWTLFQKAE